VPVHNISAAELFSQAAAEALSAIKKNRPAALHLEDEPIHQMRVATRRVRAALDTYSSLFDEDWADELGTELRWLAHTLGAARDLDVLRARLRDSAKAKDRISLRPLQRILAQHHRDAQSAMIGDLRSERYHMLIERLNAAALSPQVTVEAEKPTLEVMLPLLLKAWKKVRRAGGMLDSNSDSTKYHKVRKMGKRIRYSTEPLAELLMDADRDNANGFVKKLKKLQDILGELQDAVVAKQWVESIIELEGRRGKEFKAAAKRLMQTQLKAVKKAIKKYPRAWDKAILKKKWKWMTSTST